MKFDQTFIAIRQRNIFEILDLSLHLIRRYFLPLLTLLAINAIPFLLIDWFLLGWLASDISTAYTFAYLVITAALVANQSQIGTIFITCYLGRALFEGNPSIQDSISGPLKKSLQLIWLQGILRLVFPAIGLSIAISQGASLEWNITLLIFIVLFGLVIRARRPFTSEILLLEKTPMHTQDPTTIKYATRSSALHTHSANTNVGRLLLMALLAIPLTTILFAGILLVDSSLNLHVESKATLITIYWPVALWLVAGFIAVVRFLSYIDIRIRQEGWAVELRIRAEAISLNNQMNS